MNNLLKNNIDEHFSLASDASILMQFRPQNIAILHGLVEKATKSRRHFFHINMYDLALDLYENV